MRRPLRILHVEDSDNDAELILHVLHDGGLDIEMRRVESESDYLAGLNSAPDLILADYSLPQFGAERALHLLKDHSLDIPFIVISGTIGEDTAVATMRAGAHDYLLKNNLARLVPALRRELGEARGRAKRRQAEAALRDSEKKLRLITENVGDLIVILDTEGRRLYASKSYKALLGESKALEGTNSFDAVHPEDRARIQQVFLDTVATGVGQQTQFRFMPKNGNARHIESQSTAIHDVSGQVSQVLVVSRDITERKCAEARIQYLAHHDALTGLPNRILLQDLIGKAMAQAERDRVFLALLFIDLDRFKTINDSLGHAVGDGLLEQVAVRLRACARKSDILARLGGDEFLLTLVGVKQAEDASRVAEKILKALAQPFTVNGRVLNTSCSIGISIYPVDGKDVETLMKNADMAMYHAKEYGRNSYQFFSSEMNTRAQERLTLENALHSALEHDEFVLHYQPLTELRSGRVTGVEALLRWRHPELGLVSPAKFIPVAEETGKIWEIGHWVMRTACLQMRAWQAQPGFAPMRLSVNLSARQLRHADLIQQIAASLRESNLPRTLLELEITESIAMHDPRRTERVLGEISDMGIALAIDDFGTGYSSMNYLKRFPIGTLKIDRSFIDGIPSDANDVAITRATVAMAKSLNLRVVAEGVETEAQRRFLLEVDCDECQGDLFSEARAPEDLEALLWQQARAKNEDNPAQGSRLE
jgi:diguanylate cyclase (GGDEF)-like protein/PAS domain S-box-containing protein